MKKHGRYESAKPKKKGRKVLTTILCILLVLVIGIGAAGVMVYKDMIGRIERVETVDNTGPIPEDIQIMMGTEPEPTETTAPAATTAPTVPATTGPTEPAQPMVHDIINVLLIGQSYRKGEENYLSDTLILVSINKDTKSITLTSFPRDTWVDLPDYKHHTCGWNMINTNYALGYTFGGTGAAMDMITMCLKNNFGIEVDYCVEISLQAFPKIIDLLGGVRIELDQAEADYINGLGYEWLQVVEPGENRLFGEAALEYARMRHSANDDSDYKRGERQRKLLTALFGKVLTKSLGSLRDIAYEVLPLVKTNMTDDEITALIFDLLPMLKDMTIDAGGRCPVQGTGWSEEKDVPGVGMREVDVFASEQQKRLMAPITEGYSYDDKTGQIIFPADGSVPYVSGS